MNWKNWFRIWCGYSLAFGAGYFLSWSTKIVLYGLVMGDFGSAIRQISVRSGTARGSVVFSRCQAVMENFKVIYSNSQLVFYAARFSEEMRKADLDENLKEGFYCYACLKEITL